MSFGQAMNAAAAPERPGARRWLAGVIAAAAVLALVVGWNLYKQQQTSRFQTAVGEPVRGSGVPIRGMSTSRGRPSSYSNLFSATTSL